MHAIIIGVIDHDVVEREVGCRAYIQSAVVAVLHGRIFEISVAVAVEIHIGVFAVVVISAIAEQTMVDLTDTHIVEITIQRNSVPVAGSRGRYHVVGVQVAAIAVVLERSKYNRILSRTNGFQCSVGINISKVQFDDFTCRNGKRVIVVHS